MFLIDTSFSWCYFIFVMVLFGIFYALIFILRNDIIICIFLFSYVFSFQFLLNLSKDFTFHIRKTKSPSYKQKNIRRKHTKRKCKHNRWNKKKNSVKFLRPSTTVGTSKKTIWLTDKSNERAVSDCPAATTTTTTTASRKQNKKKNNLKSKR